MTAQNDGQPFGGVPLASNGMPVWLMDVIQPPEDSVEPEKFTAVVSNPPYQVATGGKNHQIYADFYIVGREITQYLSMIFPLGWQTSTGRASGSSEHKNIREDRAIVSVDNYYENRSSPVLLFPSAGTGGVNIVFCNDERINDKSKFYEYGVFVEEKDLSKVKYWDENSQEIFNKIVIWINKNACKSADKIISPQATHLYSTAVTSSKDYSKYVSPKPFKNWVKCWGALPNKKGYGWSFIDPEMKELSLNKNSFNYTDYKVIFGIAAGPYAVWRKAFIIEPNSVYTGAFIGAYFKTLIEAQNFLSYMKTLFYRMSISEASTNINTVSSIHRFVPDLAEVTNPRTGLVGYESDWTDDDLKILFKDVLTDEDWEYIEATAIASDPAGERIKANSDQSPGTN